MKNILIYNNEVNFRAITKKLYELKPHSKRKIEMKCQGCEKVFERFAMVLFKSGSFLCQQCSLKEKLQKHLEVGFTKNRLTVIKRSKISGYSTCRCACGVIKDIHNVRMQKGITKSCGCLKAENLSRIRKSLDQTRENHPMWKGGVTDKNRAARSTDKYKQWRLSVFERDNFECRKCGQNGGELNAHHIKELSSNTKDICVLENGITFCKACHIKFHAIYGKKDLSQKMIDKFLLVDN